MFTPRAVFQELVKGYCYTIYQDPPTGQFYLMIDMDVYTESGKIFKGDIEVVFRKLDGLKKRQAVTINIFFWILLVGLLLAIIVRYASL
jgi:hypothetical protein